MGKEDGPVRRENIRKEPYNRERKTDNLVRLTFRSGGGMDCSEGNPFPKSHGEYSEDHFTILPG